jgi:hypothetical protein
LSDIKAANTRESNGFKVSENCMRIPKSSTHRIAPLLSIPMIRTMKSNTKEIIYRGLFIVLSADTCIWEIKRKITTEITSEMIWLRKYNGLIEASVVRPMSVRITTGARSQ